MDEIGAGACERGSGRRLDQGVLAGGGQVGVEVQKGDQGQGGK
jgi:hypothetical protein